MNSEIIEKEAIDVSRIVPAHHQSPEISNQLAFAERLGNGYKGKVSIEFNTVDGPKRVNTTIWSVTEKYIQLKNNVHIPIKSIIEIV